MIKCYEKYKQTKNIWYPEVPSHWLLSKVKYVAKTIAGGTPSTDKSEYWDNGDIPWLPSGKLQNCDITTAEKFITEEGLNNSSTKWIKSDTTLIALTGATCANIGFLRFQACANQSVVAIDEFPDKANSRFLFYMLISMRKQILTHQSGGAQAGINDGNVKNLFLVVPPLNEQLKIAQYLDHQTVIIDQLIQQKEKLIELLKEKRQAVINEAVTKGLNPNTKMKDSRIEWLGDVPGHWEVTKMKFIATITRGAILRPVDDPAYFDDNGEWTYLNISDATKCDKYLYEGKLRLSELGSTKSARVNPDNLILTASATIGKPFINKIPVCVHDGFIPITNIKCSIDYLYHYLRNPQLYIGLGKVNTQKNIYLDEVKDMFVTQPPMDEQYEIVSFLERFELVNNNLLQQINTQIEKLKEYRQSIISEAVTGKIDVRDWQPSKKQVA
jgi:type I restriction enzyme S subunit